MLLHDKEIRELSLNRGMIEPFSEAVSGNEIISYGLTSAGYDLRLGYEVLVFKNSYGEVIDPKRFKDDEYRKRVFDLITGSQGDRILIPAGGYILGTSLEYLRIPANLKGRCTGKSTFARAGIIVNTTPLEPEWEGNLTIEISNASSCPSVVYMGEGIAQLEFEMLVGYPEITYKTKSGKYQNQIGVTPSKVL